ncbi:MAG: hypothetical protein ACNYNX_02795 [Leucobacter sp.]
MPNEGVFDFSVYQAVFNSGDDDTALNEYWDEHLEVIMPVGPGQIGYVAKNREEFRAFLAEQHDGVREYMRLQALVQQGEQIFAEIDMDFVATEDRPAFGMGALKRGEFLTVKMFGLYTLRENRLWKLKLAFWPPNVEVSDPPVHLAGATPPDYGNVTRARI